MNAVIFTGMLAVSLVACGSEPTTSLDAAGVVQTLAKQGMPVTLTVTFDQSSDPEKLLGRANGYSSKASFTDQRVDTSKVSGAKQGDVNLGGTVEVFGSAGEAEVRAAQLKELSKKPPALGEYNYVKGPVVVRVSKELMPGEALEYEGALGKIVK
ncbi:hypothetical protein [Streptosporangium sp. NPDC051022]|uniref:hypothetical protein n=1 Tax=Streptosporangium sp. NPDC051022 TaxID=3155752 RepID=UPI003428CFC2